MVRSGVKVGGRPQGWGEPRAQLPFDSECRWAALRGSHVRVTSPDSPVQSSPWLLAGHLIVGGPERETGGLARVDDLHKWIGCRH